MTEEAVIIYTDGACSGNPGPGGWGCHYSYKGHTKQLCGGERDTTNNRMELLAVIMALENLTRSCKVVVYSDSQYVVNGITTWIHNWKIKEWRKVKNVDLWQKLDEARNRHEVEWQWVKGHAGDKGNELADKLANKGLKLAR
jgi:ribonuclease HI